VSGNDDSWTEIQDDASRTGSLRAAGMGSFRAHGLWARGVGQRDGPRAHGVSVLRHASTRQASGVFPHGW